MQQILIIFGMLIGGLGLFLLAVSMITDGLKSAAGHALRGLLGKWTRSPAHGILTGLSITAIVQSSSAVTVATIGFVNAGLLSMRQALGVVYGANIGTTMTGWLVALVGFEVNIEAFALPIIGLGMILHLTGNENKRGYFGLALVGFGLFFIGVDVLRDAFEGLVSIIDLNKITAHGVWQVAMFVGIGMLMTMLTQSSSAAIAITLTAATGGIVGLYAAGAMVIGANVGTTSTAALAVIGATPNAKRVATAHIAFNLITAIVALMILPVLFGVIGRTQDLFGLEAVPAVTLALFHTLFNFLGVLLMFPLSNHLARFLEQRYVTQEELEGRPHYLDSTVIVTPLLGVNALVLELSRIIVIVRRMALEVLSSEIVSSKTIARDHVVVETLSNAVSAFITRLEREALSKEVSEQLTKVLRSEQHLLACADQVKLIAENQLLLEKVSDEMVTKVLTEYRAQVAKLMEKTNPADAGFSFAECELQLDQVQAAYDDAKEVLLLAGAELRIPVPEVINIIDQNSRIRRMTRQMVKAIRYLNELSLTIGMKREAREPKAKPLESVKTETMLKGAVIKND